LLRLKIDTNKTVTICITGGVVEFKLRILSYLVGKGVSTTNVCNNRYTPIKLSMMVGKHENASFLLNHGAKIDAYCENEQCAKSLVDYLEYNRAMRQNIQLI